MFRYYLWHQKIHSTILLTISVVVCFGLPFAGTGNNCADKIARGSCYRSQPADINKLVARRATHRPVHSRNGRRRGGFPARAYICKQVPGARASSVGRFRHSAMAQSKPGFKKNLKSVCRIVSKLDFMRRGVIMIVGPTG